LTEKLLKKYKQKIADLKLIPGGGGCFELTVDGELIYSKLKIGKFPDEEAMLAEVGRRT
jgi:selenoprotein W-related protein